VSGLSFTLTDSAFQCLLQLTNAGFPTGAFSHSYGLETYVQAGTVNDLETFRAFARAYLQQALAPTDGAVVGLVHRAVGERAWEPVVRLDRTLTALKVAREPRAASLKTGRALLRVATEVFRTDILERYAALVASGEARGNLAVAFGCVMGSATVSAEVAVLAFLTSSVTSLTAVATRLIPLSPTAAQRLVREFHEDITRATLGAVARREDQLASSVPAIDIAAMRHERLYSRLYMS